MSRWPIIAFITLYLGVLSWGVVSHTLSFNASTHTGMYFIVWDMFCGWSGFDQRLHAIAQGDSGRYYDVTRGPWKEIHPFGRIDRMQYDAFCLHYHSIVKNVLRQTEHEPIRRVFMVEEVWSKKFNVPGAIWDYQHGGKQQRNTYYHLRQVLNEDLQIAQNLPCWQTTQYQSQMMANPRLQQLARAGRPFMPLISTQPSAIGNAPAVSDRVLPLAN